VKVLTGAALAVVVGLIGASVAIGAATLTKNQYIAKLQTAQTQRTKAKTTALGIGTTGMTPAQVKANFQVWAKTESRLGRAFAALKPPSAAKKGNADLVKAEQLYSTQLLAIAAKLPSTMAEINTYLLGLKQPTGGKLLNHALAELSAAGFKV